MLERAERKGDKLRAAALAEELNCPPFPIALDYLWKAFIRLRMRKASGMAGPEPLSWPDLDAFARVTRFSLSPWEVRLIEDLDGLYLAGVEKSKPSPPGPDQAPDGNPTNLPRRTVRPRQ